MGVFGCVDWWNVGPGDPTNRHVDTLTTTEVGAETVVVRSEASPEQYRPYDASAASDSVCLGSPGARAPDCHVGSRIQPHKLRDTWVAWATGTGRAAERSVAGKELCDWPCGLTRGGRAAFRGGEFYRSDCVRKRHGGTAELGPSDGMVGPEG